MKAITVYPVWAWAIVNGRKRVENRTWWTHHRGPLLVHAAADSPAARRSDVEARKALEAAGVKIPPDEKIARGAIIGMVEVIDALRYAPRNSAPRRLVQENLPNLLFPPEIDPEELATDPLAVGPYCWILRHPLVFRPPIPFRGRQGLFDVPGRAISREIAELGCRP